LKIDDKDPNKEKDERTTTPHGNEVSRRQSRPTPGRLEHDVDAHHGLSRHVHAGRLRPVETGLTRGKNVAHTMAMNVFIYATA